MSDQEFGTCDICKLPATLTRKYFRYLLNCECHSPNHFELVCHCKDCIPKEPTTTKITYKTSNLKKL